MKNYYNSYAIRLSEVYKKPIPTVLNELIKKEGELRHKAIYKNNGFYNSNFFLSASGHLSINYKKENGNTTTPP